MSTLLENSKFRNVYPLLPTVGGIPPVGKCSDVIKSLAFPLFTFKTLKERRKS